MSNFYTVMLLVLIFLLPMVTRVVVGKYNFIWAASGEVHQEKFVYYKLIYEGTLLVELTSTSGDCDLYVSQNTIEPTYDPQKYCLQSVTCGLDSVIVPKSFNRPLGLGIFGHPSHEVSQYIITVSKIDDSLDVYHFDPYEELLDEDFEYPHEEVRLGDSEDEDSVYWILFRSLMKCLIEVLILFIKYSLASSITNE